MGEVGGRSRKHWRFRNAESWFSRYLAPPSWKGMEPKDLWVSIVSRISPLPLRGWPFFQAKISFKKLREGAFWWIFQIWLTKFMNPFGWFFIPWGAYLKKHTEIPKNWKACLNGFRRKMILYSVFRKPSIFQVPTVRFFLGVYNLACREKTSSNIVHFVPLVSTKITRAKLLLLLNAFILENGEVVNHFTTQLSREWCSFLWTDWYTAWN